MLNISFNSLMKYNIDTILKTRPIYQIYEIIKRYQEVTHTPNKVFQNMTVEKLKDVAKSGLVTIGAHTLNHPILRNEDDVNSKYEIDGSICELANLLKKEIKYFAYPNGIPILDFSEREKLYLRNSGIQLAFTSESKKVSSIDNPMCIPRIAISNKESTVSLKKKIFLGSFWNTFTKLKPTGEYSERKELNKIVSAEMLLEQE